MTSSDGCATVGARCNLRKSDRTLSSLGLCAPDLTLPYREARGSERLRVGRGERIRTSGPCLPKTVLYQAELLPDAQDLPLWAKALGTADGGL